MSSLPTAVVDTAATLATPVAGDDVLHKSDVLDEMGIDVDRATGPTDDTAESEDPFLNKILSNRYRVRSCVGTGGFGAVYEAEDTKIHKRVAVKVLSRALVTDTAMVARFRKEAESASQVGHPNIIDITDFDRTSDGYYFIVMEFLDGEDLSAVIRSGEEFSLSRILGIMIQVCRALNAAHCKGIIHRDLKPGNIYLISRGSHVDFVKVLDFGISKMMEVDDETSRLTRTGQIIGTPLYMSPEQALGEENLDHRVDIYSVGVIMYELVTGQPPFTAVNYLGIIAQHASDPPRPPSKVRPDLEISAMLEAIILKAMAKRPEDRFSTMAEMEAGFIHCLADVDPASAVTYSPDATPPPLLTTNTALSNRRLSGSKPVPLWTLLLTVAMVLGAVAVYFWLAGTGQPVVLQRPDLSLPDAGQPDLIRPDQAKVVPAPATIKLAITTRPSLAEVFDSEGNLLGRTPLSVDLVRSDAAREFSLKLAGHRPARITVVPNRDQSHRVPLKRRQRTTLPDDPKGW